MDAKKGTDASSVRTPANIVTCVRILLIPVLVALMLVPWGTPAVKPWVVVALFALISLTDSLDGYLARSRDEVTTFGKFMDPIADKLLVLAAMMALVEQGALSSWVPIVILARELLVSGMRMIAASAGTVIAASYVGKAKTLVTMVAVCLFIIMDASQFAAVSGLVHAFAWLVMIAAVVLTIVSMVDYFVKAKDLFFARPVRAAQTGSSKAAQTHASLAPAAQADGSDVGRLDPAALEPTTPEQVVLLAQEWGVTLATAESLTGGLVSSQLTSIPGSSLVVKGGIASYMPSVKVGVLHVASRTIEEKGVVSSQTAAEMAEGALRALGSDVAVSMTGVAGPTGGTAQTPVGTVWMGLAIRGSSDRRVQVATIERHFEGNRAQVREQTAQCALSMLILGIRKVSERE